MIARPLSVATSASRANGARGAPSPRRHGNEPGTVGEWASPPSTQTNVEVERPHRTLLT
ncbi:hypothetical protein [Modestobacter marinus]|uniref:hypothetical protein n=1 Tax=Modestobacter marinus TaxID=477641 RepID=UPI001C96DD5E|nr:hypothetical protein [Modestobacter marinus]